MSAPVVPSSKITTTPSVMQKAKLAYSQWFLISERMPKTHRYVLGGKIEDYFLGLLENIFATLYLPMEKKVDRINITISKLDGVKFFLQIAWENRAIPNKQYADLSELLNELGRILGGWKKGIENKTPAIKREK